MKFKTITTELECTAEELRQSNTLSESFMNIFRNAFNGQTDNSSYEEEDNEDNV